MSLKMVEFFCGIGGVSAALQDPKFGCSVDQESIAIDINQDALKIFSSNFEQRVACRTIESLDHEEVAGWPNEFWWLSPPCQPYTLQGKQRDLADHRSLAFKNVCQLVAHCRPIHLALENVSQFDGSAGHAQLRDSLQQRGYQVQQIHLCPTELGSWNRRPRFFLIASQSPLASWKDRHPEQPLEPPCVDAAMAPELDVPSDWLEKYADGLDVCHDEDWRRGEDWQCGESWQHDACQPHQNLSDERPYRLGQQRQTTKCFTSAYGKSPLRSGSYLQQNGGVRLFSPREILRQLDFPESFQLPPWPAKKLWPLVGNSLSLRCVRYVLRHIRF